MNDEDINLEIKLIEFRKQKLLESEIAERAKKKREELEIQKREMFRKNMSHAYDVFMSSFKYSLPVGISNMAILQSVVIFPVVHFGIFFYRLNYSKEE